MTSKRKKKPVEIDPWDLDDLDRDILKLMVNYPAAKRGQIAKKLGITFAELTARVAKPAFQRTYEDYIMATETYLERYVGPASVRRLHDLVRSPDPKVALQAIKIALQPLFNKHQVEVNQRTEIVFKTRIGESGQLIQDVIEIPLSEIKPTGYIEPPTDEEDEGDEV